MFSSLPGYCPCSYLTPVFDVEVFVTPLLEPGIILGMTLVTRSLQCAVKMLHILQDTVGDGIL